MLTVATCPFSRNNREQILLLGNGGKSGRAKCGVAGLDLQDNLTGNLGAHAAGSVTKE